MPQIPPMWSSWRSCRSIQDGLRLPSPAKTRDGSYVLFSSQKSTLSSLFFPQVPESPSQSSVRS